MGRTLKEWRVHKDLKQSELAELIGVPVSTYNSWERNTNSIKVGNVPKICKALDVKPQQVIFFEEESHFNCDYKEA